MVIVCYDKKFSKTITKIKDNTLKLKLKKQIIKIVENPKIGKPMKHSRKGTRELYITPFRLAYAFIENENKLIFLDLYHKDKQ
jgi:mRNA-degrading endonuclease RelE of RelBE toxin-antitoxin system